ncbi:MAG: BAX inhibitor (BI)-1/YccA family protein, partial [Deltaproteobacteria bacterium]
MRTDTIVKTRAEVLVSDYVRSVYNWMGVGLALTGFVAYYVSTSESISRLVFGNPLLLMVLIAAELGL